MYDEHDAAIRYAPNKLREYLTNYAALRSRADGVRSLTYDTEQIVRKIGIVDRHHALHIVVDVDRALLWLAQLSHDPIAAAMLCDHYQRGQQTADIADEWGLSQRTVNYRMSDGITSMSRWLGWRKASDKMIERVG